MTSFTKFVKQNEEFENNGWNQDEKYDSEIA